MKNVLNVFAVVAMLVAVAYAFMNAAQLPDVHMSYSNDACVKVINYEENDNYNCENMPARYNHVWVK